MHHHNFLLDILPLAPCQGLRSAPEKHKPVGLLSSLNPRHGDTRRGISGTLQGCLAFKISFRIMERTASFTRMKPYQTHWILFTLFAWHEIECAYLCAYFDKSAVKHTLQLNSTKHTLCSGKITKKRIAAWSQSLHYIIKHLFIQLV